MKNLQTQKGFTVVELLVAISVFAMIMTFAVTIFTRGLRAQRAVVSLISANDNASLAIEAMAREIRRGYNFETPFLNELHFINAELHNIIYRIDTSEGVNAIMRADNDTGFQPLTAKNVYVSDGSFVLIKEDRDGKSMMPRVTISLKVSSPARDARNTVTAVHTTVSARGLQNPIAP